MHRPPSPHTRILPARFARDLDLGRAQFVLSHGDAPLLMITLQPEQLELETGLAFAASDAPMDSVRPAAVAPIQFRTEVNSVVETHGPPSGRVDMAALVRRVIANRQFVVPVRKRQDSGTMSQDRITVGRAFNQDIVLRHESVSKFHAWLQVQEGELQIADAGSRNGTRVNDTVISQRSLVPLHAGDLVTFGSVAALALDAETVFEVLSLVTG